MVSIEVSVVIPCFRAADYLDRCLASLAAQTLARERFEAVLVFNGPDDGGAELARRLLSELGLQHQLLDSKPGAGRARNVGIAQARGRWTTLLDVDDELSANFLDEMLAAAVDPTVVPVSGIVDESYDGVETQWWFNQTLNSATDVQRPEVFYPHLTLNAGKLIPTDAMRRHPFDEDLRSGEDIVVYCTLFEAEQLQMTADPARAGARYRRHVTDSSVSRQTNSFDFMVLQRVAVISRLNEQLATGPGSLDGIRKVSIASQCHFLRRYLRQHPQERARIDAELAKHELPHLAPYLRPQPPRRALICGDFSPAGTPESRATIDWVLDGGQEWQVISTASDADQDWALTWATALSVARHDRIPVPAGDNAGTQAAAFVPAALASLSDMGELDAVETVGSWIPAHLAGALHQERTGVPWTAHPLPPLTEAEVAREIESWRMR